MTTIKWAEFPKIKESVRGHKAAYDVGFLLAPTYAGDKKRVEHIAHKIAKIVVLTGGFLLLSEIDVLASTTMIDAKAQGLYNQFIGIAKWIVAGKGGWDSVNKMLKEDFEGAKKAFLQYLIIFGILIALPKSLDMIASLFEEEV